MAFLRHDIVLDDTAFKTASDEMAGLKAATEKLKTRLETMYQSVSEAMDTSAGDEIKLTAKDVLLKPIEDLSIVIAHVSETLDTIIGSGYYKDIFIEYQELNRS